MSELIGRLQVVWDGLLPRERILVGIAGGALALTILILGIVLPIQSATENASDSAVAAERQLEMTHYERDTTDTDSARTPARAGSRCPRRRAAPRSHPGANNNTLRPPAPSSRRARDLARSREHDVGPRRRPGQGVTLWR